MGYIYAFMNRAMPGLMKIGYTDRTIAERKRELQSATGVPVGFEETLWLEVDNAKDVERRLHDAFDAQRFNSQREFFEVTPQEFAGEMQRWIGGGLNVHEIGGRQAGLFPSVAEMQLKEQERRKAEAEENAKRVRAEEAERQLADNQRKQAEAHKAWLAAEQARQQEQADYATRALNFKIIVALAVGLAGLIMFDKARTAAYNWWHAPELAQAELLRQEQARERAAQQEAAKQEAKRLDEEHFQQRQREIEKLWAEAQAKKDAERKKPIKPKGM